MKINIRWICFLYALGHFTEAIPTKNDPETSASAQITKWQKQYNEYIEATLKTRKTGCTLDKILYRQEWGSLSQETRKEYIKAVKCVQKKSPISSLSDVPGARSRYDDFLATHIIQAPYIHFSGLFLHWHRYLLWLYEKTLREECGYQGTQPYWDWTLSWNNLQRSPLFDGSPTSMGGNGETIPHGPITISGFGNSSLQIPSGTGGGCVKSGPFKDYQIHLGPLGIEPKGPDGGLGFNPHCLNRDFSPIFLNNTRPTAVETLIKSCTDLGCFDTALEAITGVHGGGHFGVGGVMTDPFASPGDPVFYLHHAQIDRVWTIWQNLDAKNRTNQVFGTGTAFNDPPSPDVTLNTIMDFGVLAPKRSLSSVKSTIEGPFCYMYI